MLIVVGTGLKISDISKETFALPDTLAQRLDNISEESYNGRGFSIIRGINPKHFREEEHPIIFAGVSLCICPERGFQDFERKQVLCKIDYISLLRLPLKP